MTEYVLHVVHRYDNSNNISSGPTFNFSCFCEQNFSISTSIIFYITKYPSNVKAYQKLIKTCKYFFNKNPILILRCLQYIRHYLSIEKSLKNYWAPCFGKKCDIEYEIIIKKFGNKKLWITDKIDMINSHLHLMEESFSSILIDLIPRVYRCDAKECYLYAQTLNFDQFLFFASSAKKCDLCSMTIKDAKDGHEISLETIIANLLYLEQFQFDINADCTNISSNTVEKLLKIGHFSNIKFLIIYEIPDSFNYQPLKEYANIHEDVLFKFRHRKKNVISQKDISDKDIDKSEAWRLSIRISDTKGVQSKLDNK